MLLPSFNFKHLLSLYKSKHPEESQIVNSFDEFLSSSPHVFERSHPPGHLTGSCMLLDPTHQSALMTYHKKLLRWLQLGGHADSEQNLYEVCMNEAREESGIDNIEILYLEILDLDCHSIPARELEPSHFHYDVRFLLHAPHTEFKISEESLELAWVSLGDKKWEQEASLKRLRNKTLIQLKNLND